MAKGKKPIGIIDRRLASGSVHTVGGRSIPLVEPQRWTVRVVNSQISDARLWEMQAEKGWVYAEEADISIPVHEIGYRVMDGRLVKGERGQLVLMKMLQSDYAKIARAKDDANKEQTFGAKAVKNSIVNAVASEPGGDQGAEFIQNAVRSITVTDSREAVSLED